jgi:hypothetical protein
MHEFPELERRSTVKPAASFAVHPHGSPLCRTSRCIAAPGATNLGIAQYIANRPQTMTAECDEYPAFRAVTSRVCSIQCSEYSQCSCHSIVSRTGGPLARMYFLLCATTASSSDKASCLYEMNSFDLSSDAPHMPDLGFDVRILE